jgi:hypothetical protein
MLGYWPSAKGGATLNLDKRNLLFALAGARQEILDQCPTERIKFQSLGLAILITSVMATVSMWFALNSVLGLNAFLALPAAILWGLIILGIDRWLVSSMPSTGRLRWSIAMPRVVLALLLGTLISTPIVLRIFQSEIDAQIVVIKQARASAFIAQQENSKVGQQVAYWTKDVANLEKVIASNGEVQLNPSTDPILRSLTMQRAAELKLEHQYYEQWQCQLYGGPGCTKKGDGPLAQASQRAYEQAAAQVTRLTNQIQRRDRQLTAGDSASRRIRVAQATSALPAAKQHLAAVTAEEDALQAKFARQNLITNGLLIRLEALNQLAGKSFTINAARLLLFLLFLVIECLPVTVKLLQQPGNYEKILQQASEHELREAKRVYGARARTAGSFTPGGNAHAVAVAELHEIWQPRTRVMPETEKITVAEPAPEPPTEAEDSTHLIDDALRRMQDIPVPVDSDRRSGGIELRYGDDDL